MQNLKTFEEFVNENYLDEAIDANGFNPNHPMMTNSMGSPISSPEELIPGKEYILIVNDEVHPEMIYQGQTGSVYIFNSNQGGGDIDFEEAEMMDLIGAGNVSEG